MINNMAIEKSAGFQRTWKARTMKTMTAKVNAIISSPKNAQKIRAQMIDPNIYLFLFRPSTRVKMLPINIYNNKHPAIMYLPFYAPLSAFVDKCARGIKWLTSDLLALTLTNFSQGVDYAV